jgi:hypothetical protein
MLDGIKLLCLIYSIEYKFLKTKFEFNFEVNSYTGELIDNKETSLFYGLKLLLIAKKYLVISGSFHKAFSGGINYNDFPYSKVCSAIQLLEKELMISSNRFKIQRFEFGVNIREPPLSYERIRKNVIVYKGDAFNRMEDNKKCIGIECKKQRYTLKIYSKSLQENLIEDILRVELRIVKLEHVKKLNVRTLSDFLDSNKMRNLGFLLSKTLKEILMDNDKMDSKFLPHDKQDFYTKCKNPKYWEQLIFEKKYTRYSREKKKFISIMYEQTNENLTIELQNIVEKQWEKLLCM